MGPRLVKSCEIFLRLHSKKKYPLVPEQRLINVSAASDGTVWGIDSNRNTFKWNGKGWLVHIFFYYNLTHGRNLAD